MLADFPSIPILLSTDMAASKRFYQETLGLPLLDRLGKRVQLTEAGTLLYGYARRMLDVLDDATVALEEMRGIKRGTLRVGASTTVGIYLLPAALGAFKKLHPGLVISLEIGTRAQAPSSGHRPPRAARATEAISPKPATSTSGPSWSKPPGPTSTDPAVPTAVPSPKVWVLSGIDGRLPVPPWPSM